LKIGHGEEIEEKKFEKENAIVQEKLKNT